jgi:hypothetical protein
MLMVGSFVSKRASRDLLAGGRARGPDLVSGRPEGVPGVIHFLISEPLHGALLLASRRPFLLGFAAEMVVALLTVPGLRDAFDFGPMEPWQWLLALAAGVVGVLWLEVYKALARRA